MSGDFGNQQFQRQQFKHRPSDISKRDVDHDAIKEMLKTPAKGLLITGILSVVLTMMAMAGGLLYGSVQTDAIVEDLVFQFYGPEPSPPDGRRSFSEEEKEANEIRRKKQGDTVLLLVIGGILILSLAMCAVYMFAVAAGVLMGQRKNYKLCRLACIIALIPVLSPLLVVGIPFGMMGLAKLGKPEVRKAFS